MKFKSLLLIISIFLGANLMAGNINIKQAKKVAKNFYYEKYNRNDAQISFSEIEIVSAETETDGTQNFYYVFQFNNGGYIMVSADDCLNPVLGYSFEDKYVSENQPLNVQSWFGHYKDQVIYARSNKLQAEENITAKWDHYLSDSFEPMDAKDSKSVEPLMTTKWNQSWPYNSMCPVNDEGQAITGCVATGYAQCLYYWRFPLKGSGNYCYYHPDYGQLCADYENTWYQWDAMTDSPKINDTAVGELMYHIGVAVDMDYSATSSGAWLHPDMIESHFNISTDFHFIERDYYGDTQWKSIMMEQLDQSYPMPYVGFTSNSGHFWVCDGYQDEDYFHMNWGWGGSADGFFIIDNLQGFNYGQQIGLDLYPDANDDTYPNYASGADTLTYLEGSICDGSGPVDDYLNNTTATWLIDPQTEYDSISSIILKIKRFDVYNDGDKLRVYNGGDNTAPLLAELSGSELPETIHSTSNQVFIEFITDGENTAGGFYMNYECQRAVFCNEMTQVTSMTATITDGSESFYYSNSSFCIWVINPGVSEPITMHFNSFDTEEEKDVLKIYDGATQELLQVISGNYDTPPEPITSPSGKMNMVFVTNSSIQGQGWEAWYDVSTDVSNVIQDDDFKIIPNPVTSDVSFGFTLNAEENVIIEIVDLLGHQQKLILNEKLSSGYHSVHSNINHLPNGVYLCRLTFGNESITKRMVKTN